MVFCTQEQLVKQKRSAWILFFPAFELMIFFWALSCDNLCICPFPYITLLVPRFTVLRTSPKWLVLLRKIRTTNILHKMQQRLFSTGARVFERQVPRFVTTLKEASKPALEKSQPITKPFGFDSPTYLSHESSSITNVLSLAAREKRQKQLDHDIVHSPFYESKSFTNTQGKIFTPPVSYFKKDKAKYFPSFTGYTLLNHKKSLYDVLKGKVSIVRIFSTVSGQNCTDTYTPDNLSAEGYEQLQKQYPHTQIVDVNLPQSWIKGLFVKNPTWEAWFRLPDTTRTLCCPATPSV